VIGHWSSLTRRPNRRYRRSGALLALGLAGGIPATGCDRSPSAAASSAAAPEGTSGVRTTRGDLALRNLSDHIDTLQKRAAKGPLALPFREQLVDQLITRTQLLGTYDDFARVLELGESAVRDYPRSAKAWLLRARTLGAVHRFDEATKDLEAARGLGADVDAKLAALALARGQDVERVRDFARRRVTESASSDRLGLLANAEAALGEFEAADEHYAAALAGLRDVSPFPVALLSFARGVMWAEQADAPERARPHYIEALRRVPRYVVANVHLAELEAEAGQRDAAIERLLAIVDQTSDPEPAGLLGELLLARDAHDSAASGLIGRARDGYQRLLERHRAAFLDHAAEFFGGPGHDPNLSVTLARENLALRPTPRAHALAIEAALAAHDTALTCQLVAAASPLGGRSRNLAGLLSQQQARCVTR
jgi:tetratricopeptide (TPR) repeat protein